MDKSPDAFRTISEVAEHLETPAHVLRFWESRFPQIRPVKRAGGRRYYRPADVSLLTGIKRLLHDEGMTIRGVQKILREQGVRHVAGISGDGGDDDEALASIDQVDGQVAEVVVPLRAEPVLFRPAPGLAAAMAKVVDQGFHPSGPASAPASDLPVSVPEPAQGALLLTPAPAAPVQPGPEGAVEGNLSEHDVATAANAGASPLADGNASSAFPETAQFGDDFEDDDLDEPPMTPLAARIRSLPADASAAHVGANLLGVVARLRTLRDRMADAAQSGRS